MAVAINSFTSTDLDLFTPTRPCFQYHDIWIPLLELLVTLHFRRDTSSTVHSIHPFDKTQTQTQTPPHQPSRCQSYLSSVLRSRTTQPNSAISTSLRLLSSAWSLFSRVCYAADRRRYAPGANRCIIRFGVEAHLCRLCYVVSPFSLFSYKRA